MNVKEAKIKSAIEELAIKVGGEDAGKSDTPNPKIAELAQACGESILNPEYLLSGGEPFTTATATSTTTSASDSRLDVQEFLSSKSNGSPFMGMTMDSILKAESPSDMVMYRKRPSCTRTPTPLSESGRSSNPMPASVENSDGCIIPSPTLSTGPPSILCLRSQKLTGLKKIFSQDKLNASAIQLQLTAQSQVHFKHSKRSTDSELSNHRKRSRRE